MKEKLLSGSINKKGADPKTQETYDAFVSNGINIIHDEKVSNQIINNITTADDPIKAIADATLNVVDRLEETGQSSGIAFDMEVLSQGANVLMGEIIMIAEMSGLKPLTDEEKYMAFSLAVSKYIDNAVKSGKVSPEQLEELSNQAKETPEGKKIANETQSMIENTPKGGLQ